MSTSSERFHGHEVSHPAEILSRKKGETGKGMERNAPGEQAGESQLWGRSKKHCEWCAWVPTERVSGQASPPCCVEQSLWSAENGRSKASGLEIRESVAESPLKERKKLMSEIADLARDKPELRGYDLPFLDVRQGKGRIRHFYDKGKNPSIFFERAKSVFPSSYVSMIVRFSACVNVMSCFESLPLHS